MKHPALQHLNHRPWPLPQGEWKWRQSWLDLAFLHYRVESEPLQKRLPDGLRLQEFDGSAWVGVVPFRMAGVMRRPFPDLPHFSSFPELNLRTYVECDGKPGVWFFSLDADSWTVVLGGRYVYHLPYFSARMKQELRNGWFYFSCNRRSDACEFDVRYRPVGGVYFATKGTFEHWATERYCLYSQTSCAGLMRVEVHHAPWPLQRAEVVLHKSNVLSAAGISTMDESAVCHFSTGVDVVSFGNEQVVYSK